MAWHEAIIEDHNRAFALSNFLFDHTFERMTVLAQLGRLKEAEGSYVWSKLDLETGATSFVFNDVASLAFPTAVASFGAQEIEPRKVKLGIGEYGRLFGYGFGSDDEDTSDLQGRWRDRD